MCFKSERKKTIILEKVLKEKFVSLETSVIRAGGRLNQRFGRDLDELEAESNRQSRRWKACISSRGRATKKKSIKNIQVGQNRSKKAELIKDHEDLIDAVMTNELWYKKLSIQRNRGDQLDSPCDQVGRAK